jgi:hypothetical protein
MTWKTNPGCEVPEIKLPPGIQSVLDGIAKDYAAKKSVFLLSPTAVYAARKIEDAKKLVDKGKEEAERLKKYTDLIEKYADLLNTCPCAKVWDDEASKIELP